MYIFIYKNGSINLTTVYVYSCGMIDEFRITYLYDLHVKALYP